MKRWFFRGLYVFAFGFHSLLWLNFWLEGPREALALVTMSFGLLVIWGGLGGWLQLKLHARLSSQPYQSAWKNFAMLFVALVGMALLAEVVSTTMTNTAVLWGFSPREVYITASPNYLEVVLKHSVIVFLPQFIVLAWLHQRYAFQPWHWFIIYGLVGYLNEWLAFGEAASLVSLPFWMIIYGNIAYTPTSRFLPQTLRKPLRLHILLGAVFLTFLVAIPWAMVLLAWLHS